MNSGSSHHQPHKAEDPARLPSLVENAAGAAVGATAHLWKGGDPMRTPMYRTTHPPTESPGSTVSTLSKTLACALGLALVLTMTPALNAEIAVTQKKIDQAPEIDADLTSETSADEVAKQVVSTLAVPLAANAHLIPRAANNYDEAPIDVGSNLLATTLLTGTNFAGNETWTMRDQDEPCPIIDVATDELGKAYPELPAEWTNTRDEIDVGTNTTFGEINVTSTATQDGINTRHRNGVEIDGNFDETMTAGSMWGAPDETTGTMAAVTTNTGSAAHGETLSSAGSARAPTQHQVAIPDEVDAVPLLR